MTPAAQGRHCAVCNKVVLDFTQKTDAEILAALRHASAPCGRFRPEQLGRPLMPPAVPAPRWRAWLAAAVALWGLREAAGNNAVAQQPASAQAQPLHKAAAFPRPSEADVPTSSENSVLRGRVVDASTGEGLPGVTVLAVGTTSGVSTAADGTFELRVPAEASELSFSFIGYVSQRMALPASGEAVNIILAVDAHELAGEVVIAGGLQTRQPWPWHPRAFWSWATRPFRR